MAHMNMDEEVKAMDEDMKAIARIHKAAGVFICFVVLNMIAALLYFSYIESQ